MKWRNNILFIDFLGIFFFSGKIEMVKSKGGLAFSAVFTVVASLLMSVSICTMFGLTPTLNGGYVIEIDIELSPF